MMEKKEWEAVFTVELKLQKTTAATYAKAFADANCSRSSLSLMSRDMLTELGVTSLGHQLAIMELGRVEFMPKAPTPKLPAPKLPSIDISMTSQQWRKFINDWTVFKEITQLSGPEKSNSYLYDCCSSEVQSAILNTIPEWSTETNENLIEKIKDLVTKKTNPAVYRMSFTGIKQKEESVSQFHIRLKTAAIDCEYEYECKGCKVKNDLSEEYIKDQFIRGLKNETLQTEILSKSDELKTLKQVIKHAESFEIALRDKNSFRNSQSEQDTDETTVHQATSFHQYMNQNSKKPNKKFKNLGIKCKFCNLNHAFGRKLCPAWGKTCHGCNEENHFKICCPKTKKPQGVNRVNIENEPEESEESDTEAVIDSVREVPIHIDSVRKTPTYYAKMIINDKGRSFQIDCGADANICPIEFLSDNDVINPTNKVLLVWDGGILV